MIVVVLALGAAAAYGLSDFVGGVSARRTSPWPVAAVNSLAGGVCAAVAAALLPQATRPVDLAWGALAGLGSGLGGSFLYRGLARGRMGVVGPVSAVGAALLPVLVALALGERPGTLVTVGILLALPGIWLVAREPGARMDAGLVDGLLAGAGFGVLFAATGQVPPEAGLWPVVATQAVGCVSVVLLALWLREPWLSRDRVVLAGGSLTGVLAFIALLLFLLATHQGLLTVSAVLVSLYPAVTVLLARVLLGERLHRVQVAGLLLCGVTVACVAMG